MTRISKYDLLFIVLISSVVFIGLGRASLLDYDEGIHAEVASQIIQSHDWLTLHFNGNPRFEKPPIYNWTTAVFFMWFGVNEFWARAGSAFSSVLVVVLTYVLGTAVYDRRVGLLAVLPLMTGYEFLRQARNGTTDVMLTLFMLLTLTIYIRDFKRAEIRWYLVWVAFALGFMVKSWAALFVVIAIGINIVIEGNVKTTLRNPHFWGGILAALAIILPWHIAMYALHGRLFIDRYLVYNLVTRSVEALEGNTGSPRFYFDGMAYNYAPWFLMLPIALALELKRLIGNWNKTGALLLFTACSFGIYSLLVGTKIFHYLTPIYPILAIFIATAIMKAYDSSRSIAFSGLMVASLVAAITPSTKTLIVFSFLAGFITLGMFTISRLAPRFKAFLEVKALKRSNVLPGIANASTRLLTYLESLFSRRGYSRLAVLLMCLFLTTLGTVRSRHLYEATESPTEKIARIAGLSDALYDETLVGLALPPDYADGVGGPAAVFYSGRPINVAWSEEELFELTAEGPREIIMGERYIESLNDRYEFMILAKSPPFIYGVVLQKEKLK